MPAPFASFTPHTSHIPAVTLYKKEKVAQPPFSPGSAGQKGDARHWGECRASGGEQFYIVLRMPWSRS